MACSRQALGTHSGEFADEHRTSVVDISQVRRLLANLLAPSNEFCTPFFMNVTKTMHPGPGSGYRLEKILATCSLTRVSIVHDAPWRTMCHSDINLLNGEVMAMIWVILEAPVAERYCVWTGVNGQKCTIL